MKSKASDYRDKSRKQTRAQKQQKSKNRAQRRATVLSSSSGKFSKKASKPLTRRQSYKLEKMTLQNQRAAINAPAEIVRSVGQSVAMNVVPTGAGYAAGAGINYANSQIPKLVDGGSNTTDTSNEEEQQANNLPGGANIR